ncbi:MAG: class I SAM-dependent methyltransferase [Anaerolineales bacterium]
MAPIYDLTFLNLPGYQQAAHDLIERLEVSIYDAALDVGCGTGLLTLSLAKQARCTIGLDLSLAMLKKQALKSSRQGLNIELLHGSILKLPITDHEFTVITTAFMLLYLTPKEKQQALVEIKRMLAPGGRVGFLSSRGEIADIFLSRNEWETLLTEAGFSDIQIEERYDIFRLVTAQKREVI